MAYTVRKTARAIILTPQHDVLLMRVAYPWRKDELWILPGGGIKDGEDARDAVAREVFEETGAKDIMIVGEAWRQEIFIPATNMHLKQRFFLVHAERFQAHPTDMSEPEMDWVLEYRWWSVDELLATDDLLEPGNMAVGIQNLILQGLPIEPVDMNE